MQDVCVRREVTQPFEHRQRKIRRGNLVGEAFTNQSDNGSRVIQRVEARHDAASAVAEQDHGQSGLA